MQHEYEEQIFRLNKRIKELIGVYEKTLAQNVQLDGDHERMAAALAHSDEQLRRCHHLNVQYKHDLDKLSVDRDQSQRIHHQLKTKLNETMSICRDQNDEIATLKRSLQQQRAISMAAPPPPPSRSSEPTPPAPSTLALEQSLAAADEECRRLRADVKQLEDELHESYELIDDLEFEVEQIGYLEAENERLQEELALARAEQAGDQHAACVRMPAPSLGGSSGEEVATSSSAEDGRDVDTVDKPQQRLALPSDDDEIAAAAGGADEVRPAGGPPLPPLLRRDQLHRKLESLQQRQTRRSETLTEKFQRGLSIRR